MDYEDAKNSYMFIPIKDGIVYYCGQLMVQGFSDHVSSYGIFFVQLYAISQTSYDCVSVGPLGTKLIDIFIRIS